MSHLTIRTPSARRSVTALGVALTVGVTHLWVGAVLTADVANAATPPPKGTPPVAVIDVPTTVYAGVPATLSGSRSSAPNSSISEWAWDLGGDGRFERQSLSDPRVSKSFPLGKQTVRLRVRGVNGLVSSTTATFTTRTPPRATATPAAPTGATAIPFGTEITVEWTPPVDSEPLAYRVVASLEDGPTGTTVYVPADETSFTFTDLVPGDYTVSVAGTNAKGTGADVTAEATVASKGSKSSPSASSTPGAPAAGEPTTTTTGDANATAGAGAPTDAAGAGDGTSDRSLVGIGLIIGGLVLLAVAVGAAIVGARRRRA